MVYLSADVLLETNNWLEQQRQQSTPEEWAMGGAAPVADGWSPSAEPAPSYDPGMAAQPAWTDYSIPAPQYEGAQWQAPEQYQAPAPAAEPTWMYDSPGGGVYSAPGGGYYVGDQWMETLPGMAEQPAYSDVSVSAPQYEGMAQQPAWTDVSAGSPDTNWGLNTQVPDWVSGEAEIPDWAASQYENGTGSLSYDGTTGEQSWNPVEGETNDRGDAIALRRMLMEDPSYASQLGLPSNYDSPDAEWLRAKARDRGLSEDWRQWSDEQLGAVARGEVPLADTSFGDLAGNVMHYGFSANETLKGLTGDRANLEWLPPGAFEVADAFLSPLSIATLGVGGGEASLGANLARNLGATGAGLGAQEGTRRYGETDLPGSDIAASPWAQNAAGLLGGVAGYSATMPALRAGGRGAKAAHDAALGLDALINEPNQFGATGLRTAGMSIETPKNLDDYLQQGPSPGTIRLDAAAEYPVAGAIVDGRTVLDDIPNTSSIESSLGHDDYDVLRGIREVPIAHFDASPRDMYKSSSDLDRVANLADQLRVSGEIKPIIIAVDSKGPYVLEGAHRVAALESIGAKSFPALVVVEPGGRFPVWQAIETPENLPAHRAAGKPPITPVIGGGADVGRNAFDTITPPALDPIAARDQILHLPDLAPVELSRTDRLMNTLKRTVGAGVEEDPIATPALRAREELKPIVDAQAGRLGEVSKKISEDAFDIAPDGRIMFAPAQDALIPAGLNRAPTIQDLAARLPLYEPALNPAQRAAMNALREEIAPYRALLERVGVEVPSRADVVEGGFYLPRGRADLEGADLPIGGGGRGRVGGKKGFEKGAVFDSQAQGIDAGYQYAPFDEVMASHARDAGRRAVDQHVANYFKGLRDDAGDLLGKTAADRMDPAIRAAWQDTTAQEASLRNRLRTAERRAGMADRQADELDKALAAIEARVPEGVGKLANLPGIADRARQRSADLVADVRLAQQALADARREALQSARAAGSAGARDSAATAAVRARQVELTALNKQWAKLNDEINGIYGNAVAEKPIHVDGLNRITTRGKEVAAQADALAAQYDELMGRAVGMDKPLGRAAGRVVAAESGADQTMLGRGTAEIRARGAAQELRGAERGATSAAADMAASTAIEQTVNRFTQAIPADVNRIRYLEITMNRTAARIAELRERGGKWAGVADELQADFNANRTHLDELRPKYQDALDRSRQTPRGEGSIKIAQLSGSSFPAEVANAANKYLDAEGTAIGRGAMPVRTIQALNSLLRGLNASSDVSFTGIQGLIGGVKDPAAYGKAMAVAYRSLGDEKASAAHLLHFDEVARAAGRPTSNEWFAAGLYHGGPDTEFSIGRGLGGKLSAISTGSLPGTSKLPGVVKGLNPVRGSNRAFGQFGDALRLEMADSAFQSAVARGEDPGALATLQSVSKAMNVDSGRSARRFGGEVGELLMFAPRFFQSQLDLIGNALTKGGIEGHEARKSMRRLLGLGVIAVAAGNAASGNGLPASEYLKPFRGDGPIGDPREGLNSNFMRIRAGGNDISPFGPWDSLARGIVASISDPTYMLRTKASPVVARSWDLISGKTFMDEDARTPEAFLRGIGPFSTSDVGRKPLDTNLINMAGIKATPMTANEQQNETARALFGDDYRNLTNEQKAAVRAADPKRSAEIRAAWEERDPSITKQNAERERIKSEYQANISAAADQFEKDGDGVAFRDALAAQGIKRRTGLDQIERDFGAFPTPRRSEDRALDSYFATYDQSRGLNGKVDYDKQTALLAEAMKGWSLEDTKYVLSNIMSQGEKQPVATAAGEISRFTGNNARLPSTPDPRIEEYFDAVKKIGDSGYWDAKSKTQMRLDNPDIDALLRKYDYSEMTGKAVTAIHKYTALQATDDAALKEKGPAYADEWRDQLHARQRDQRKELDGIYGNMPDRPPETADDALRQQYYKTIGLHTDPLNEKVNWEAVDNWVAQQGSAMQNAIDTTEKRPVSPAVQEYRAAAKTIADSGYWDVKDEFAERFASSVGLGEFDTYDALRADIYGNFRARALEFTKGDEEQAKALADLTTNKVLDKLDAATAKVLSAWRLNDPEMLRLLVRWGYYDPSKEATRVLFGMTPK